MTGGKANLWDALFGEIGSAVRDVREKVVEEPWFGRPLSRGNTPAQSVAQELGWVRSDAAASPSDLAAHDTAHEMDRSIDR